MTRPLGLPHPGTSRTDADAAAPLRSVLVAVPTTGARPLGPLLAELARQTGEVRAGGRAASVLVLDNSGGPGSSEVAAAAAADGARCLPVGERGFCRVRNAALDAAREFDALVFVDDDEMPVPGWLRALVDGAEHHRADVVTGPVPVRLPPGAPRWLDGGALLRPGSRQPDGPLRGCAYSGNTLLRVSAVRRLGVRFDPSFDRTGGEDTVFFTQLARLGARQVWVTAAVAHETPDPERLTLAYVLRRAYRTGAVTVLVERTVGAGPVRSAPRRAGRAGRGLLTVLLAAVTRDPARCARGLADLAFALGWWLALTRRPGVNGRRSAPSAA